LGRNDPALLNPKHFAWSRYGGRSSHMTVEQMTELIEFIKWFGTERGVKFSDDKGVMW
jgi:hypothetical protein